MKGIMKLLGVAALAFCLTNPVMAQRPDDIIMTESGEPLNQKRPVDDIVEKRTSFEKRVLPYDPVREADIFWEKRIWRVVDVREKMNLPFAYPPRPLFTILMDAAKNSEITVYSTEDDKFTQPLTAEEVAAKGASVDTVTTFDPETYDETIKIVVNEINPEDIKRFRIKEVWFFDKELSTLRVRILGIAPLRDIKDDNGNFLYEQALFWVYYPDARNLLAKEQVFNIAGNDASPLSWEDLFEMRFFSSYIMKDSNVFDRRLEAYLSGVDILLEGEKIKQQIFNFEHDLWAY
ncbi:MAG TPA: gliding motility protein GldN [Saprospiraceae bacterium]|nr:gliding motility protein GldN [Saprospiraceae bacterium]HMP12760.1 gliding motility protein GldN [Saprospiraceae bacterium]